MAKNFGHDNPALRTYGLVALLLVVSLVFVTVYAREGQDGMLHGMQSGTSAAFTPLRTASGAVATAQYSLFTAIDDSTADPSTLSELRQQNEQLRQTVSELEEYRQEAQRLEQLLEFQDLYNLEGVTCTVLSRSTDSWNRVVTIGKGSAEGVRAGLPVAGPTGLVGQVVSTTSHTAEVRLLQDSQSGVAVMIQSNREEGILKGSLDGLLYLENVSDDAEVKTGDVIVTSGLGGSFFRGIIVGTVVKVDGDASTGTRRIVVEPNESTGPLQEVMVITAMNSEGALAPQKTDKGEDGSSEETVESEADTYVEDATVTQDYTADVYYDDGTAAYDDGTTELYYDDGSAAIYGDGTGLYDDGSGLYYDETSVW